MALVNNAPSDLRHRIGWQTHYIGEVGIPEVCSLELRGVDHGAAKITAAEINVSEIGLEKFLSPSDQGHAYQE